MKNKVTLISFITIFFFILFIFFLLLTTDSKLNEIPSALLGKNVPEFKAKSLFDSELFDSSNEFSECKGLSLIKGDIKEIPKKTKEGKNLKIPHMGWNQLEMTRNHQVFNGLPENPYFYFVHSYYADPGDKNLVLATTNYGDKFASAIASRNLVAVQFHPEKSGSIGLELYRNFLQFVEANI